MAKCKTIQKQNVSICIGDLNRKIIIKTRVLTPSSTGSVDFSEVFTTYATVWAMITTPESRGRVTFDSSQEAIPGLIKYTHDIYIRYKAGITSEMFVEYESEYYTIDEVFDINNDHTFMKLRCTVTGPTTYSANLR